MSSRSKRSLQDVVGKETYSIWVDMLRTLVPGGRTHRLSVVVAGMLQYTLGAADSDAEEPSVAKSLIDSAETSDPEQIKSMLHDVVSQLFKDAGVTYERTAKRSALQYRR